MSTAPAPLYILGAGMHPWGKVGPRLHRIRRRRPRAPPLNEAGLDWRQIQLVAGGRHHSQTATRASSRDRRSAQKLGWNGVPVSFELRPRAPAVRRPCQERPRAHILAGFLLRRSRWSSAPTPPRRRGAVSPRSAGERKNDPDWQRFPPDRRDETRCTFALLARRRMDLYGATGPRTSRR